MKANKFYKVTSDCMDGYCLIVIAPTARKAHQLAFGAGGAEECSFTDIRVNAIKGGENFTYDRAPWFEVAGKGFVYTDAVPSPHVDEHWELFIQTLKLQGRYLDTETHCRVCGCTATHGCKGGCYWVEDDLCSQCKAKADAQGS